jgi:hypothetical protein
MWILGRPGEAIVNQSAGEVAVNSGSQRFIAGEVEIDRWNIRDDPSKA